MQKTFTKRIGHDGLFLKLARPSMPENRFHVVVSKKTAPKAVMRNRTRRLLKEAIRAYQKKLKQGVDCLIIVQPAFEAQNFQETKAIVEKLFRKASLFV